MTIPGLSEDLIRQNATAESFRRGQDYHRRQAVISLERDNDALEAQVQGSDREPYQVRITFDQKGITDAECSCPYDWGGWCKHIVATLLACRPQPKRPARSRTGLDTEQREEFESTRREVCDILHSLDGMRRSQAYWYVERVVEQVRQSLHEVEILLVDGEWERALVVLEAITTAYIADWACLDDSDGFAGGFFADLGRVWSQALSIDELTPAERRKWRRRLECWQNEISPYGMEGVFEARN
jgi:uncharacterized Zn finger protein